MENKSIILNANPFDIVTSNRTYKIDVKKIHGREDIEHDPEFTKKYLKYVQKKEGCFITRLSLKKILPGFYKIKNGKRIHIEDSLLDGGVEIAVSLIKSGERPPLHIYKIYNSNCEYEYCSPDDIHIYYAYKQLEVTKIPVIIYGSAGTLEESAFKNKGHFRELEDHYYSHANVNVEHDSFYSITFNDSQKTPHEIVECLDKLESLVDETKLSFKEFHDVKHEVHYHRIIYAILVRLGEDLAGIKLLISNGLYIQSAGLLRSIYELMLNFYLVWLNPIEMSSMLKYKSLMSKSELLKVIHAANSELTKGQLKELERVYNYQYDLVSKVIEKAKISPFGESYYQNVYRFLSDITHHDFSSTARYQHALEHGDNRVYNDDLLSTVVRIADFLTTFICHYSMDDIGFWVKRKET
ncbi:DUF5677 domain-containing protein [Vibrio antiquarius]|uniref:DUF5677 domain-containing protein n=1 Tax=Vibrio diabolicus subgroup TaxID=2315253 RepID=UPI00211AD38B|nr:MULTISPECIES: DUF5677 domain-containing protein [Vibrio diabolicus subgroup]MCG6219295.1 DUF5677 domain-containing protein [Vibrio diabolicus]MCR9687764.1 DUF5677 domain-containing protein [Vibrio antiquarius]